MSGSSTQPRFENPQIYEITVPGPIDSRLTISSLANLGTELPVGVRYPGLLVWVENSDIDGNGVVDTGRGEFYAFIDGIDDINFRSLRSILTTTGSGTVFSLAFEYENEITAGTTTRLAHNLASNNLHVSFFDGNIPIEVAYVIPVGDLNTISITNDVSIANLRVVVTFVNTLILNPPAFSVADDNPLTRIRLRSLTTTTTQVLQPDTKLESIDYRVASGTPTVTLGTTVGGDDLHTATALTLGADGNFSINKSFVDEQTLYLTITGGIVHANINIRQAWFNLT